MAGPRESQGGGVAVEEQLLPVQRLPRRGAVDLPRGDLVVPDVNHVSLHPQGVHRPHQADGLSRPRDRYAERDLAAQRAPLVDCGHHTPRRVAGEAGQPLPEGAPAVVLPPSRSQPLRHERVHLVQHRREGREPEVPSRQHPVGERPQVGAAWLVRRGQLPGHLHALPVLHPPGRGAVAEERVGGCAHPLDVHLPDLGLRHQRAPAGDGRLDPRRGAFYGLFVPGVLQYGDVKHRQPRAGLRPRRPLLHLADGAQDQAVPSPRHRHVEEPLPLLQLLRLLQEARKPPRPRSLLSPRLGAGGCSNPDQGGRDEASAPASAAGGVVKVHDDGYGKLQPLGAVDREHADDVLLLAKRGALHDRVLAARHARRVVGAPRGVESERSLVLPHQVQRLPQVCQCAPPAPCRVGGQEGLVPQQEDEGRHHARITRRDP